jgi:hypothetical protein
LASSACRTAPEATTLPALATRPNPALAKALLDLGERDQAARGALVEAMQHAETTPNGGFIFGEDGKAAMKAVNEIDAESTMFLRTMVAAGGWPSFANVGKEAAHTAWLLVQHADADPDLQARVLVLMAPLVEAGQASPVDFGYLTDRVRCARREPQLFGTQFGTDAAGVSRPFPIEDVESVDERRAELGLESLADYAAELAEAYGSEASPIPLDVFP